MELNKSLHFFMLAGNYSDLKTGSGVSWMTANTMLLKETFHVLPRLMKLVQVGGPENDFSVLLQNISAP